MGVLIAVLSILALIILVGGPLILIQIQRVLREQKNFERGLKTVILLIHLPPPSEDIDVGGRDVRDVVDENTSRAQTLYSIIASTLEKGFKRRLYGQRHFGFEIIASNGVVNFYVSVPVTLIDVVQQAIISAYPAARLEEVPEQNIFSPVGKISGTIGGELSLKKSYAYPIATYTELKRDAMQSILNALWELDKNDGAGIQILIRPADPSWTKNVTTIVGQKRKGGNENRPIGEGTLSVMRTIVGSPTENKSTGDNKKEISDLDKSIIGSMEDKVRYPGFEVLIRVVASSNISQRAETIVKNIVASFALFDAPGRNGFKYTIAKDIERFVTAYILRIFPAEHTKNILNSVELASLFHFPDRMNIPTSQLQRQESKQVDGPRNIPETGIMLGYNVFRGVKKPIRLSIPDRRLHIYAVGQTGTGKSTFLENLALQDMLSGGGFAFIDPHGDTADRLLSMVPKNRTEDVIYFCPADMEYPLGLNLFEFQDADQKDFLIQECLNMLYKLYDPQHQGIMGPRYEHLFRMAALTVMADPNGGTFIDIPKLFRDPQYVRQKLQYVKDKNVVEFWTKEIPQSQRSNEFGEVTSWFVSKFGAFLSNEMMRNIIGQTKSSFDIRNVMDEGKILLVNLSKGRLGDLNSKLLGMIFVMKFQVAAMSRANMEESQRKDFCLYVDEFQNFSTDSFATMMSEARKYRLNLVVANQFTTQLSDEVRDAVFGNIGTTVAFRVGQNDVDVLARYFQPLFDAEDLLRIPNHNAVVRTMVSGVPTQPFSMATLPPIGEPNAQLAMAIKQLSAAKYGKPRKQVEDEIFERLATKELPSSTYGQPAGNLNSGSSFSRPVGQYNPSNFPNATQGLNVSQNPMMPPQTPQAQPYQQPQQSVANSTGSSFLDEWMKKRQSTTGIFQSKQSTSANSPIPSSNTYQNFGNIAPINQPQQSFTQPASPLSQNSTFDDLAKQRVESDSTLSRFPEPPSQKSNEPTDMSFNITSPGEPKIASSDPFANINELLPKDIGSNNDVPMEGGELKVHREPMEMSHDSTIFIDPSGNFKTNHDASINDKSNE